MLEDKHIENLDGMCLDDLEEYARQMRMLVLSGEDDNTRDLLVQYAVVKRTAMARRAEGRIPEARTLEDDCDSIYTCLPKYARW